MKDHFLEARTITITSSVPALYPHMNMYISRPSELSYQVVRGVYLTQVLVIGFLLYTLGWVCIELFGLLLLLPLFWKALPSCFCWSDVPVRWTYPWISCQNVISVTVRRCSSFMNYMADLLYWLYHPFFDDKRMNANFCLQVAPQHMSIKCNASESQKNNKHVTSLVDALCCSSEYFPSDVIW
jgi:hypothetical protein